MDGWRNWLAVEKDITMPTDAPASQVASNRASADTVLTMYGAVPL